MNQQQVMHTISGRKPRLALPDARLEWRAMRDLYAAMVTARCLDQVEMELVRSGEAFFHVSGDDVRDRIRTGQARECCFTEMTRGVPLAGKALLHGLVYCGECGHKMVVSCSRNQPNQPNRPKRERVFSRETPEVPLDVFLTPPVVAHQR